MKPAAHSNKAATPVSPGPQFTPHRPLRVLIVEDSEADARLLERQIERGGFPTFCERVDSEASMRAALDRSSWDIIISDYALPGFGGLAALSLVRERALDIPFIIVSGAIGEEIAVQCMKAGAHDYVMKDNCARLVPAITRELRDAEVRRDCRQAGEALCQAHAELECRVRERTAELAATNECLTAEINERKRAEEALRMSEERYRTLIEQAADGLFVTDAHARRFLDVNSAACRMVGYTREELLGLAVADVVAPADAPRIALEVAGLRSGETVFAEWQLRRKDGSLFPGEVRAQQIPDGRIQGFVRNLTKRKRAEERIAREQARFKLIFDTVPIGIALHTTYPDGRFTRSINDAHLRICGLTREQPDEPETYLKITHPDDRAVQQRFSDQVRAGAIKQFSMEKRYLHPDGKLVWVNFSYQREIYPDGTIEELTTVVDITGRKQMEEALRRSEHHLANFFNQAPIGLVWLSSGGTILRANLAQLDLLGYATADYLGHAFTKFCGEPSQGLELLKRLAAKETVSNFPMTRRRQDGTIRHVLVDANSVWSDNQFQYSSIFLRDISDRIELEREILQVGEREHRRIAQDLHDGLGQLLVGAAYLTSNLRQDLAAKSLPEVRPLARILEVINEAIAQTRNLAQGLHPVEPEPNGLMVALETLAARTNKLFHVSCSFTCRQPVLIQDNTVATHLFRIAQEAITNAIKHGKPGRIDICLTETPERINLAIRDNGTGVPARQQKKPGMGLRIMRYRAGMIGGSLAIQKEADGGTVIVCTVQTSGADVGNHPEDHP